jgi:hypothetical protein
MAVSYRTSNCRTQGAGNRMIGNTAVLTAAKHSSQFQPSSSLGQRVAIYCMLPVITSTTGKLQLLYISKYHVTFITFFADQIVQWILWVGNKNYKWLMWENNYTLRNDTSSIIIYLYVGSFLGTARNEQCSQKKTHMGKIDRDFIVLYLVLWSVLTLSVPS